jgi:hypothetical protein
MTKNIFFFYSGHSHFSTSKSFGRIFRYRATVTSPYQVAASGSSLGGHLVKLKWLHLGYFHSRDVVTLLDKQFDQRKGRVVKPSLGQF